jgi:hypothetical protein
MAFQTGPGVKPNQFRGFSRKSEIGETRGQRLGYPLPKFVTVHDVCPELDRMRGIIIDRV